LLELQLAIRLLDEGSGPNNKLLGLLVLHWYRTDLERHLLSTTEDHQLDRLQMLGDQLQVAEAAHWSVVGRQHQITFGQHGGSRRAGTDALDDQSLMLAIVLLQLVDPVLWQAVVTSDRQRDVPQLDLQRTQMRMRVGVAQFRHGLGDQLDRKTKRDLRRLAIFGLGERAPKRLYLAFGRGQNATERRNRMILQRQVPSKCRWLSLSMLTLESAIPNGSPRH
jgi:hypothetical protein